MRLYHSYIHYNNHKQNYMKTSLQGRIQRGAQGARAPPLISKVVIFQPIILYTLQLIHQCPTCWFPPPPPSYIFKWKRDDIQMMT